MRLVENGRVAEALQLLDRPNCGLDELVSAAGRAVRGGRGHNPLGLCPWTLCP